MRSSLLRPPRRDRPRDGGTDAFEGTDAFAGTGRAGVVGTHPRSGAGETADAGQSVTGTTRPPQVSCS